MMQMMMMLRMMREWRLRQMTAIIVTTPAVEAEEAERGVKTLSSKANRKYQDILDTHINSKKHTPLLLLLLQRNFSRQ
jgi:hypothetical protein